LATDVPDNELDEYRQQLDSQTLNPMLLKKRLAREIVAQFYNANAVQEAEKHFEKVVQHKEVTDDVEVSVEELKRLHLEDQGGLIDSSHYLYNISISMLVNNLGLAKSKSEAKRLIDQGGVQIIHKNGERTTVSNDITHIQSGDTIKVGKRRFVKIVDDSK
jgi:tyrosyl-tRNA synthetase